MPLQRRNNFRVASARHLHSSHSNMSMDDDLASIVLGTQDCGAEVNRNGQLEITSEERSRHYHRTALILARASPSLTEYDFRRLLQHPYESLEDDAAEDDAGGGLLEGTHSHNACEIEFANGIPVFPVRGYRTLQRLDSWVLMFASPAQAADYQSKVQRLQDLYLEASPVPDATAINAAPDNPRQGGLQGVSYTLTTPFQRLSLSAQLHPFDSDLEHAIGVHRDLVLPKGSHDSYYPVRLYVERPDYLNAKYIRKLLKLDGIARGRAWAVSTGDDAIIQIRADAVTRISHDLPADRSFGTSAINADNWRVNFLRPSDAAQFARIWHRRVLPTLDNSEDARNPTLEVECLF